MDSEFDKVFHKKVASEDHDEVILLTKKNPTSKLFSQNTPAEIIHLSDSNDIEIINENDEYLLAAKSPQYRIEFTEKNQIEMVPIVKPNIEKKDCQLKSTQSMESQASQQAQSVLFVDELKQSQIIEETEEDVIVDEIGTLNEIAVREKNFSLLPRDDSIRYLFPKEMKNPCSFQPEIEVIQIEEEEKEVEAKAKTNEKKEFKPVESSETDDEDDGIFECYNILF